MSVIADVSQETFSNVYFWIKISVAVVNLQKHQSEDADAEGRVNKSLKEAICVWIE